MLGKDSIESNQFVVHIYTAAGATLRRFIEQQFLSITLSNGEPVIEVIPKSKLVMYFIIGIAVVVAILLAVVLALSLLYLKSMRKLSQVKAVATENQLDTESPAVKIMKFLQVIGPMLYASTEAAAQPWRRSDERRDVFLFSCRGSLEEKSWIWRRPGVCS